MRRPESEVDKYLKKTFEEYSVEPSEEVWRKIASEINKPDKKRPYGFLNRKIVSCMALVSLTVFITSIAILTQSKLGKTATAGKEISLKSKVTNSAITADENSFSNLTPKLLPNPEQQLLTDLSLSKSSQPKQRTPPEKKTNNHEHTRRHTVFAGKSHIKAESEVKSPLLTMQGNNEPLTNDFLADNSPEKGVKTINYDSVSTARTSVIRSIPREREQLKADLPNHTGTERSNLTRTNVPAVMILSSDSTTSNNALHKLPEQIIRREFAQSIDHNGLNKDIAQIQSDKNASKIESEAGRRNEQYSINSVLQTHSENTGFFSSKITTDNSYTDTVSSFEKNSGRNSNMNSQAELMQMELKIAISTLRNICPLHIALYADTGNIVVRNKDIQQLVSIHDKSTGNTSADTMNNIRKNRITGEETKGKPKEELFAKTPKPSEKDKKVRHWLMEVMVSPGITYRHLTGFDRDYLRQKNESDKIKTGFYGGMALGYRLSSALSVHMGFGYSNLGEKEQVSIENHYLTSDTTIKFSVIKKDSIYKDYTYEYVFDTVTIQNIHTTHNSQKAVINHNQNYHFISIPVTITYNKPLTDKISLSVSGGPVMNLAITGRRFEREADNMQATPSIYAPNAPAPAPQPVINPVSWSVYGSLGAEYKVSDRVSLGIKPAFRCFFTSIFRDKQPSGHYPYLISLDTGIKIKL